MLVLLYLTKSTAAPPTDHRTSRVQFSLDTLIFLTPRFTRSVSCSGGCTHSPPGPDSPRCVPIPSLPSLQSAVYTDPGPWASHMLWLESLLPCLCSTGNSLEFSDFGPQHLHRGGTRKCSPMLMNEKGGDRVAADRWEQGKAMMHRRCRSPRLLLARRQQQLIFRANSPVHCLVSLCPFFPSRGFMPRGEPMPRRSKRMWSIMPALSGPYSSPGFMKPTNSQVPPACDAPSPLLCSSSPQQGRETA